MIPHIANFIWNRETPLSYLRYLTMVTFRHHHPDWTMNLWTAKSDITKGWSGPELQDFQGRIDRDYMPMAKDIDVNIVEVTENFSKLHPVHISDIIRWHAINGGGWYFDLDQIIVRRFDNLCNADFVAGGCLNDMYSGVLAASSSSKVPQIMHNAVTSKINTGTYNYCATGPWLLKAVMQSTEFKDLTSGEHHNITPLRYFYPVFDSRDVNKIYDGDIDIPATEDNYALHWFGGHPDSQRFNAAYTGAMALTSEDAISRYIRSEGIV